MSTNNREQSEAMALATLKAFRDEINKAITQMEVDPTIYDFSREGPWPTDFEIVIGDYVIKRRT